MTELSPGVNVTDDAALGDWARANYSPGTHAVGSVPMLPRASGGAVSAELLVYGTANVRVVGALSLL